MSLYHSKRQVFAPSCPSGGTWYACGSGSMFAGCCTSDPCSKGCTQGNIRPASFDPAYYGLFADASCGQGSDFFTCLFEGDDPFWGCCKTNPCGPSRCSDGNLVPAFLDLPNQMSAYEATGGTSSTTVSSTRSTNAPSSPTQSTVFVTVSAQPAKKASTAAIAGGAAGGGAGLIILTGLLIYYILHTRKSRNQHRNQVERRPSDLPAMMTGDPSEGGKLPTEAPPVYASPNINTYPHPLTSYPSYTSFQDQYNAQYELPTALSPTSSIGHKPLGVHRLSELSGETARRSELESPWRSPNPQSTPQSPRSTRSDEMNWTRHATWQEQPEQDLGIRSEDGRDIFTRAQSDVRGYPGV